MGSYGQDLSIISLGTNDISFSMAVPTFIANLRTLTAALAANGGSVAWRTPPPLETTVKTVVFQDTYVDAMKTAAANDGIPIIDIYGSFGSWAAANTAGMMLDTVHPNTAGHAAMAQTIYNVLTAP